MKIRQRHIHVNLNSPSIKVPQRIHVHTCHTAIELHTHQARATRRTELMRPVLRTKEVRGEAVLALLDVELRGRGDGPEIALTRADGAAAGACGADLGDGEGELEGAAVAVAMVGLELFGWGRGGFGHGD
jgi:hypothetical protein